MLEHEAVDGLGPVARELSYPVGCDAGEGAAHDLLFGIPDGEEVEECPGHRALARSGIAAEEEDPGAPVHCAYGLRLLVAECDAHLLLLVAKIALDILKDRESKVTTPLGDGSVYSLLCRIEERGGHLVIPKKDDPVLSGHIPEDRLEELGVDRAAFRGEFLFHEGEEQRLVDAAVADGVGVLEEDIIDARPYPEGMGGGDAYSLGDPVRGLEAYPLDHGQPVGVLLDLGYEVLLILELLIDTLHQGRRTSEGDQELREGFQVLEPVPGGEDLRKLFLLDPLHREQLLRLVVEHLFEGILSHRLDELEREVLAEALDHSREEIEELMLEDGQLLEDKLETVGLVLLPLPHGLDAGAFQRGHRILVDPAQGSVLIKLEDQVPRLPVPEGDVLDGPGDFGSFRFRH